MKIKIVNKTLWVLCLTAFVATAAGTCDMVWAADLADDQILTGAENATDTITDMITEPDTDISVNQSIWNNDETGWSYYDENGQKVSGCIMQIGEQEYLFDADGVLLTGVNAVDGKLCYFSENGDTPENGLGARQELTGWQTIADASYYFDKDAGAATGWKKIGKNKFYFDTDGKLLTGIQKIGKSSYCFKENGKNGTKGQMLTGWQLFDDKGYYFYSNGKMAKDTYIDGYMITSNGAMSKKAFLLKKKCQSVIEQQTDGCKTKEQKLRACYNYTVKSFSYKRSYSFRKTQDWEMNYAYDMLTKKQGNCYNFAATFSFLARELGYSTTTIAGMTGKSGGGWTPHSWVEITMGKKTYIFDPEMEHAKGYHLWKKTYTTSPLKYRK